MSKELFTEIGEHHVYASELQEFLGCLSESVCWLVIFFSNRHNFIVNSCYLLQELFLPVLAWLFVKQMESCATFSKGQTFPKEGLNFWRSLNNGVDIGMIYASERGPPFCLRKWCCIHLK